MDLSKLKVSELQNIYKDKQLGSYARKKKSELIQDIQSKLSDSELKEYFENKDLSIKKVDIKIPSPKITISHENIYSSKQSNIDYDLYSAKTEISSENPSKLKSRQSKQEQDEDLDFIEQFINGLIEKRKDLELQDLELQDLNSQDLNSQDLNSQDLNSQDLNSQDLNSQDLNLNDLKNVVSINTKDNKVIEDKYLYSFDKLLGHFISYPYLLYSSSEDTFDFPERKYIIPLNISVIYSEDDTSLIYNKSFIESHDGTSKYYLLPPSKLGNTKSLFQVMIYNITENDNNVPENENIPNNNFNVEKEIHNDLYSLLFREDVNVNNFRFIGLPIKFIPDVGCLINDVIFDIFGSVIKFLDEFPQKFTLLPDTFEEQPLIIPDPNDLITQEDTQRANATYKKILINILNYKNILETIEQQLQSFRKEICQEEIKSKESNNKCEINDKNTCFQTNMQTIELCKLCDVTDLNAIHQCVLENAGKLYRQLYLEPFQKYSVLNDNVDKISTDKEKEFIEIYIPEEDLTSDDILLHKVLFYTDDLLIQFKKKEVSIKIHPSNKEIIWIQTNIETLKNQSVNKMLLHKKGFKKPYLKIIGKIRVK
jgi:hypothetical protein